MSVFRMIALFVACTSGCSAIGQQGAGFADSIRQAYGIPELGYAVVSSSTVFEQQTLGVRKINTSTPAEPDDLFRIGSNTKAITGFIAALQIKEGKISWETRFFDLFPELKAGSRMDYHDLTLLDLLSFRTTLFPYTYTNKKPGKRAFTGDEAEQRYQFAEWFFQQEPVSNNDSIHFSNLGYVAAGMMLEKVSGQSFRELVEQLGTKLGITFYFGQPNMLGPDQPWGHDATLKPEPPKNNYKLSWLLPAGNITMSLPDYTKFIQLQLQGLKGESALLTKDEFYFLHFGLFRFSVGWFQGTDESGQVFSYNIGNPGTFLSRVILFPESDRAFVFLSNAQTAAAAEGMEVLFSKLYSQYP